MDQEKRLRDLIREHFKIDFTTGNIIEYGYRPVTPIGLSRSTFHSADAGAFWAWARARARIWALVAVAGLACVSSGIAIAQPMSDARLDGSWEYTDYGVHVRWQFMALDAGEVVPDEDRFHPHGILLTYLNGERTTQLEYRTTKEDGVGVLSMRPNHRSKWIPGYDYWIVGRMLTIDDGRETHFRRS